MNTDVKTLNRYACFDSVGAKVEVVAEDMATAVTVYRTSTEPNKDPQQVQTAATGIRCVLPDVYTTFNTSVYDTTGGAAVAGCMAMPTQGSVVGTTKQYFEAKAVDGWRFKEWQIDGVAVEDSTPIMQLEIPVTRTGTCVIRAVFEEDV
jgi:hypothetical protein